jgi:hypothetical protein
MPSDCHNITLSTKEDGTISGTMGYYRERYSMWVSEGDGWVESDVSVKDRVELHNMMKDYPRYSVSVDSVILGSYHDLTEKGVEYFKGRCEDGYYYVLLTQNDGSLTGLKTYLSDRVGKDDYKGYDDELTSKVVFNCREDLYKELHSYRVYTARVDGCFLGSYDNLTEDGIRYFEGLARPETPMVGSPKQVKWAQDIKRRFQLQADKTNDKTLPDIPHAVFWINHRNDSLEELRKAAKKGN